MAMTSIGYEQQSAPGPNRTTARDILSGERYRLLDRRASYYQATQHDAKAYDFDGNQIGYGQNGEGSGRGAFMPVALNAGGALSMYVPLRARRPSAPRRLGKVIVNAFTNIVFGEDRFPTYVGEDGATCDFANACANAGELATVMTQVRRIGGSSGSSAVSWGYVDGRPRFRAHEGKCIYVDEWADRDALVPAYAMEMYWTDGPDQWDPVTKKYVRQRWWHKRTWSLDDDVVYLPAPYRGSEEPTWIVDDARTVRHGDGVCHLEWIQNTPEIDVDGCPDYDGLYEELDEFDIIASVVARAVKLNCDPTVVLKMDPDFVARMGISKGSDNALAVGQDGDASYMELGGQSITVGREFLADMRRSILEAAECVVPDPNEVAAQGVSSVSIKALYLPMLGRASMLRQQYGRAIRRIGANMNRTARARPGNVVFLPKKRVEEPVMEDATRPTVDPSTGMPDGGEEPTGRQRPTGEVTVTYEDVKPGEGDDVDLSWPPWFPVTTADMNAAATALTTAAGGKAVVSRDTATELFASAVGRDPSSEVKRIASDREDDRAHEATMGGAFGAFGAGGAKPPFAKDDDEEAGDAPGGEEKAAERGGVEA